LVGIDLDIIGHPHRMKALQLLNRPVFLLAAGWLEESPWNQACMLASCLPAIIAKTQQVGGPSVLLVSPPPKSRIRKLA
jgi:hypothetical protein